MNAPARSEWSTAAKVGGFVALAAAVFGIALVVGNVVGPVDDNAPATSHGHEPERTSLSPVDTAETYALDLQPTAEAGPRDLAFTIRDSAGEPVTEYDEQHEKMLHLVVVRRDLGGYRHVHPTLDAASGQWSVPIDLDPGTWRVYADFKPTGGAASLAEADLSVAGEFAPTAQGADNDTSNVDGYQVHLSRGDGMLALHVQRDGMDVTDLEPYLGAYGHLVAIRAEDMTYLHVHPQDGPAGPEVAFHAALDEPGRYRLFFDFQRDGAVHRAEFNLTVAGHDTGTTHEEGGSGEHDH